MEKNLQSCRSIIAVVLCVALMPEVIGGEQYAQSGVTTTTTPVQCSNSLSESKLDVFFIVDSSSSMHQGNFTKMMEFVASIIEKLKISSQDARVGLMQYNSQDRPEFSLNTYQTKEDVLRHVREVQYMTGVTYTGKAIRKVLSTELVPEKGYRQDVPNVIIVLTDGLAQDDVLSPSNQARDRGAIMYAIGITFEVGQRQLLEIAGYKRDHVFLLDDFESFKDILSTLEHELGKSVEEECKGAHGGGITGAGSYSTPNAESTRTPDNGHQGSGHGKDGQRPCCNGNYTDRGGPPNLGQGYLNQTTPGRGQKEPTQAPSGGQQPTQPPSDTQPTKAPAYGASGPSSASTEGSTITTRPAYPGVNNAPETPASSSNPPQNGVTANGYNVQPWGVTVQTTKGIRFYDIYQENGGAGDGGQPLQGYGPALPPAGQQAVSSSSSSSTSTSASTSTSTTASTTTSTTTTTTAITSTNTSTSTTTTSPSTSTTTAAPAQGYPTQPAPSSPGAYPSLPSATPPHPEPEPSPQPGGRKCCNGNYTDRGGPPNLGQDYHNQSNAYGNSGGDTGTQVTVGQPSTSGGYAGYGNNGNSEPSSSSTPTSTSTTTSSTSPSTSPIPPSTTPDRGAPSARPQGEGPAYKVEPWPSTTRNQGYPTQAPGSYPAGQNPGGTPGGYGNIQGATGSYGGAASTPGSYALPQSTSVPYGSGGQGGNGQYGGGGSTPSVNNAGVTTPQSNQGYPTRPSGSHGANDGMVEISCDDGRIQVALNSPPGQPFTGWAFVKSHFDEADCRFDFQNNTEQHVIATLRNDRCGLTRQRSSNPPGIAFSTTIIFMHHRQFITEGDKAYRLQCSYMESEKRVTQTLDVSMLTTQTVERTGMAEMPACQYTLREGRLQGPPVKTAIVGMKVVHRWDCEAGMNAADVYGIKVHTCFVRNNQGKKVLMLDEAGCAVDKYVLNNLKYTDDLMTAYVESFVFKFADSNQVFFDCQISLCYKENGGCQGVSLSRILDAFQPPNCTALTRGKRFADGNMINEESLNHNFDVPGETIFVIDSMSDGSGPVVDPSAIGHIGITLTRRSDEMAAFASPLERLLPQALRAELFDSKGICLSQFAFLFGAISLLSATLLACLSCMFLLCLHAMRRRRKW